MVPACWLWLSRGNKMRSRRWNETHDQSCIGGGLIQTQSRAFSYSRCGFEKELIQCKKKGGTFMSKANNRHFQCLKVNVSREQNRTTTLRREEAVRMSDMCRTPWREQPLWGSRTTTLRNMWHCTRVTRTFVRIMKCCVCCRHKDR